MNITIFSAWKRSFRWLIGLVVVAGIAANCWARIDNEESAGQTPGTDADPGPDHAIVVWANTDDDDADGVPDAEQMTAAAGVVEMPREDELYEITRVGNFCRAERPCNRWTVKGNGVRIWYRFIGDDDPVLDKAASPWAPESFARMEIGGFQYRQLPPGKFLKGSPADVAAAFFVEPLSPGLKSVEFIFRPCGREAWERRGILRLAAIGMDVYDLRGWGAGIDGTGNPQVTHPISGPPMGSSPDPWKVGGAITDGASICLLRVVRPEGAEMAPIDGMRVEVVKPVAEPAGALQELSMRAGGTLITMTSDA